MPKIPSNDALVDEYFRGNFRGGFCRSRKGNLWRDFEGVTVTIFARDDGFYGWCIAGHQGKRFSHNGYETEDHAMAALTDQLGVVN